MPSWQARLLGAGSRLLIRRRDWGGRAGEQGVARRARLLFGSPRPFVRLWTRGVRITHEQAGPVHGEWLTPASPADESASPVGQSAAAGVVLYLHGGGYVSCSPVTHRPITATLARLCGRPVFAPDYRLAPEHRYPAALDDAVASYRWLLARGTPPGSVALAGDSAGGGLVLATLLRARDEGLPAPACGVCFSPWTDMTGAGESVRANDGRCAMFRPENIAEFSAAYLGGASPLDIYASPARASLVDLPPVLLQVGSTELLLDDAALVHRKILAAGGRSTLEVYEDVPHVWQMLYGLVPEARAALKSAADFIRQQGEGMRDEG
jgi:epsilon-lactone hydrolase